MRERNNVERDRDEREDADYSPSKIDEGSRSYYYDDSTGYEIFQDDEEPSSAETVTSTGAEDVET